MFQGNLKNLNFFFSNLFMVVCFVSNVKAFLNDRLFYWSLSLPVGHSYEMVVVVVFQPHGCIGLLSKLVVVYILFLCITLCRRNVVFRQTLSCV